MALGLPFASLRPIACAAQQAGLSNVWRNAFRVGVAVGNQTLDATVAEHLELIAHEFNAVTAENAMKWGVLRPDGVTWQWARPDAFMEFAAAHEMYVVGHTLVWHSQIPRSVFVDADGNALHRRALLERMQAHIDTLAGRYRGRVHAWDVVNEAADNRGDGARGARVGARDRSAAESLPHECGDLGPLRVLARD